MNVFSPTPLSVSGKPILLEDEVEVKSEGDVKILIQKDKKVLQELFPDAQIVLTNLRLISIIKSSDSSSSSASTSGGHRLVGWGFHLSSVTALEDCGSNFIQRSTRIRVIFQSDPTEIGIKFTRGHGIKDEFLLHATRTLSRKTWLTLEKTKKAEPDTPAFSVSNAGVSGLLRRQERDLKTVDAVSSEALTDLDALMRSAREVVGIVQRYASLSAEKYAERGEEHSETSTEMGEVNEMDTILQNIGIISPVTKFSAGRLYHVELSRQLADLLLTSDRLKKLGGSATLTDLYCLFNRARGTELVSPDDFRQAAELVDSLSVGLRCRRYPSGVLVIHLDSLNEAAATRQLLALASEAGYSQSGLSATEVSHRLNLSIVVAKEILAGAEVSGALARDESLEGVYYFRNRFPEFVI